jgi:hypothetical protein
MLGQTLAALLVLCSAALAGAAPAAPDYATPPRLGYVEGEALFWRPGAGDWEAAQVNIPLAAGDALATRAGKLELQIGAQSFIRAGDDTQLRLQSNEPDFLQLAVSAGRVAVDARDLRRGAVQIDTPNGSITVARDGYYRVDVDADATHLVVRRGGSATLAPVGGNAFEVASGEAIEVTGTATAQYASLAAPPFDDWDRWNYDRADRYLAAPRSYAVAEDVYGSDELERNGQWRYVNTYGRVWVPSAVPVGWAPYTAGRWLWDPLYGWSWVDAAPWGWAPFHYGRWVWAGYWAWAPGPVVAAPFYSPALVAFFGGPGFSVGIGVPFVSWVALGWGEPLIPWWGGVGFIGNPCWWGWGGPRVVNNIVINNGDVVNGDVINIHRNRSVPGAVVGVPKDQFDTRDLQRTRLANVERGKLEPLRGALPVPAKGNAGVGGGAPAKQRMPDLAGLRSGGARTATQSGAPSDFSRGGSQSAPGGDFSRGSKAGAALRAGAGSPGDTKPGASTFDALRQRGAGAAASGAPNLNRPSASSPGMANLRRGQSPPSLGSDKRGSSVFDTLRQRGAGTGRAPAGANLSRPSAPSAGTTNLRRGAAPPAPSGSGTRGANPSVGSTPSASAFDALRSRGGSAAGNSVRKPSQPRLSASSARRAAEARAPLRSADKPSTAGVRTYRAPSQYTAAAPAPAPSASLSGFSRGMGGGSFGGSAGSLSRGGGGGGMANFGRGPGMGGGGRGGGGALGSAKLGR